jgi:hypothetical protein
MDPLMSRVSQRAALAGLIFLCGCYQKPEIRQYTVKSEARRKITTEDLRSEFPPIPFRWSVPPEWRIAANDEFSKVAWSAGPKDPLSEARITLTQLSSSTAGLEAQLARWSDQVDMGIKDPTSLLQCTKKLDVPGASGVWVEMNGPDETILGVIIERPEKVWMFKYRSPLKTAKEYGDSFRKFAESLQFTKIAGE